MRYDLYFWLSGAAEDPQWHDDLDWRQPWGRIDLADRFVGLTLPYSWEATAALPAIAGAYGLDAYDPQADQLVPAGRIEALPDEME
ncbi:hypothetical protein [Kribbella sp. NPDC050459]|uniref:hypothetical protein n=1 Tax=Kribbella sp. NPDC050459 TaxID=3155785 RepID=UPI0033E4456C